MGKPRVGRRKVNVTIAKSHGMTTSITFTSDDLTALTRYVQAGQVMLQVSHPVMAKLKAGLTRLGLPKVRGGN